MGKLPGVARDESLARSQAEAWVEKEQEAVKQQAWVTASQELASPSINTQWIDPECSALVAIQALINAQTPCAPFFHQHYRLEITREA